MKEFLAENNSCGQTLLQLVSRGNAVIAEILRLKDYIPNVYRLETKQDVQKYGDIVMDFSYFKISEAQENKIENNEALRDFDEAFRENHIKIINRFYLIFESIHTYVTDLNHYLDELQDGMFIHQSLETVFADMEGRQLLCEALYLYGTMLLMVDAHIEGTIRERLLVSYYRYTPQRRDTQSCIDDVCKLFRDTGYSSPKRPNTYPEDYFKRIQMRPTYVDIVIGRLRSDDIYNQLSIYPLSKHRSTALATQAAMLYVCLYFDSSILHNQTAIMREIVDKYFPDNWVVSIYMGFTVNLIETWDSFRAAKLALNNTLETINIKNYANGYGSHIPELYKSTVNLLKEGMITRDNLLKDINKIINVLRDCNVTIRWLMLHSIVKSDKPERNKRCKQIRDLVVVDSKYEPVNLFKLLLNTAQLEHTVREMFRNLLDEKEQDWEKLKLDSFNSLQELSDVFSGTKPLTRIEKNTNLQKWFSEISKQVEALDQTNTNCTRIIAQLIQALEEVQEYHQLDTNMQVIQFLTETRKFLHQMLRNMNIKEDVLITMQIIGDLGYGWELIDTYTPIMQLGIKREPTLVIKLRAVFLKLSSALETPLLRINQAISEDLISVSQYYSSELEIYIRKVLQIIPNMMFEKLSKIIQIQTLKLKELPTRLEKDKLKEFAQLNVRFEFAELTHSISVYSEGMRMMKSTLVGVVCLDPKVLLDDGLRKELVQHISKALHSELTFHPKSKPDELEQRLKSLGQIMDGYKRSFEYIQDYVNINGLKIWQEEVTRIINYNVEQECNGFLRNKIHDWESAYQSRHVHIPKYPPTDSNSENFIGRLAREIIKLTDPKTTSYIEQISTWYDAKTQKVLFSKESVKLIASAIEITGLVGLDRLYSFMITTRLKKVIAVLENKDSKNISWKNIIDTIHKDLRNIKSVGNVQKFYQTAVNRSSKLFTALLDDVLFIGQLQLLRNLLSFHLRTTCKFDAKNMDSSLQSLNKALLQDMISPNSTWNPSEEFLEKITPYFDYTGLNNPFNKVYITVNCREEYITALFMSTICNLSKMYLFNCKGSTKRLVDQFDGAAFTSSIHTIFKQFHSDMNENFIQKLCQYIIDLTKQNVSARNGEIQNEVVLTLKFLDMFVSYSKESHQHYRKYLPEEIKHTIHSMTLIDN